MRPLESMGHTGVATATAAAAACVTLVTCHVPGPLVDVKHGAGRAGGGCAGASAGDIADERQRPKGGIGDRQQNRRWSHRRHPRHCQHHKTCAPSRGVRLTRGQRPTSRAGKNRGFLCAVDDFMLFEAAWRKECISHPFVRVKPSLPRCAELDAPLVHVRIRIPPWWVDYGSALWWLARCAGYVKDALARKACLGKPW